MGCSRNCGCSHCSGSRSCRHDGGNYGGSDCASRACSKCLHSLTEIFSRRGGGSGSGCDNWRDRPETLRS